VAYSVSRLACRSVQAKHLSSVKKHVNIETSLTRFLKPFNSLPAYGTEDSHFRIPERIAQPLVDQARG